MKHDTLYRPPGSAEYDHTGKGHPVRWATVLFSAGVVLVAEAAVTIEWSTPYCNDPDDGPAYAIFGAPLPYERFSGVSSLHYDLMPHLYLLDIALLCAIVYPLVRAVTRRAPDHARRFVSISMAVVGFLLCSGVTVSNVFRLRTEEWSPVESVARSYESYWDARPVGASFDRHYDCKPSTFWFGP